MGTSFGDKLKALLEMKHMKQTELAERIGVQPSYISRMVTGDRVPGRQTLIKMSAALNMPINDIIDSPEGIPVLGVLSGTEGIIAESQADYTAGEGLVFIELPPGYTQDRANKEGIYALRVRGDSMVPILHDGAYLYVRPVTDEEEILSARYAIFHDDEGRGWVKFLRFKEDGIVILDPIGPGSPIARHILEITTLEKVILIIP